MQVQRVTPGRRVPARLVGAVLTRDLTVSGARWTKGRRLTGEDLVALAGADPGDPVTVLVPEPGELHEDDAALRLAAAAAHATDGVEVSSDIHADRAYRTAMAAVYTRRAIEAALARLR